MGGKCVDTHGGWGASGMGGAGGDGGPVYVSRPTGVGGEDGGSGNCEGRDGGAGGSWDNSDGWSGGDWNGGSGGSLGSEADFANDMSRLGDDGAC